MGARVLIIGVGDVGSRFAAGLAADENVDELVLAGLAQGEGPFIAGMLASSYDVTVRFRAVDGTRLGAVEKLLKDEAPDLIVQSASLIGPWTVLDRRDPTAQALNAAGLGVQLPAQLPILMTVMTAVRAVDFQGPVANISFPDVTHPILDRMGLAPTVGLGNISMHLCRVRAALRARAKAKGEDAAELPLIRLVSHRNMGHGVYTCQPPDDPEMGLRVYLGEAGERADELAYEGYPLEPSIKMNFLTCAAALPVLKALVPGAAPLRYSTPSPRGLPGGYPVRIAGGKVELDLPEGVDLDETVAFLGRFARGDGVEAIEDDGTVIYTEAAKRAVAGLDPGLTEPLAPEDALERFQRLWSRLNA
ncbi:MAG: hypothetical protein V3T29_07235 [Alphaproteobacteria bacterium]